MYALLFNFDNDMLLATHENNCSDLDSSLNQFNDILTKDFSFIKVKSDFYIGHHTINPVNSITCVLAVQELAAQFDWFEPSIKSIKMMRISEEIEMLSEPDLFKYIFKG